MIPGLGRSAGEGIGYPLQYSWASIMTGKESACNAGNLGSIPGLGRSTGEGKGCPLQYSGLEHSMDCIVHGVAKSQTRLSDFHFHDDLLELTPRKDVLFIMGLECKSRKSRDTWSNRQIWPWSTK